jgi:F-type H+-transporting ATPase subunit epsilon
MLSRTLQFDLISPERTLISEAVRMVRIPVAGISGETEEIGILPHHKPLIAAVVPGVVIVENEQGGIRKVFVAGGFLDVHATGCNILAEEAVAVEDIQLASVTQEISYLKDDLTLTENKVEIAGLHRKLAIAEARLKAIP